jgi:hypothetical protein
VHITSTIWFEFFVLFNIVMVGITTGLELENKDRDHWTTSLSSYVTDITLGVFTIECILKIVSEGYEPWQYFLDIEFGYYNTFDFFIVLFSYVFIDSAGGGISALRMLRLIRLLSFIKYVPQLRILISGLLNVKLHTTSLSLFFLKLLLMCSFLLCLLCRVIPSPNAYSHVLFLLLLNSLFFNHMFQLSKGCKKCDLHCGFTFLGDIHLRHFGLHHVW